MTAPDCATCPVVRSLATARGLTVAMVRVGMWAEDGNGAETHRTGAGARRDPYGGVGVAPVATQDGQDSSDDDGRGWE